MAIFKYRLYVIPEHEALRLTTLTKIHACEMSEVKLTTAAAIVFIRQFLVSNLLHKRAHGPRCSFVTHSYFVTAFHFNRHEKNS